MIESMRLKRLLELTRRVERARKGELMVAQAELTEAEAAVKTAQQAEEQRVRDLVSAGELTLAELELRRDFVSNARDHVKAQSQVRVEREGAVAERETERMNATRDVRKMEILWDRDRVEHKRVTKTREQQFMDETRRPKRREQ